MTIKITVLWDMTPCSLVAKSQTPLLSVCT